MCVFMRTYLGRTWVLPRAECVFPESSGLKWVATAGGSYKKSPGGRHDRGFRGLQTLSVKLSGRTMIAIARSAFPAWERTGGRNIRLSYVGLVLP